MFGLEHWADVFDQIHEENQRTIRSGFNEWVRSVYGEHGEGWQLYGAAVTAGTAEALYTFAGGMGQGLVDLLRVGEGAKKGSILGVAQDGLRVVSVVAGGLRVARLAAPFIRFGGVMSCTVSSSAKAALLSGNWFRGWAIFDKLAHTFGGRAAVLGAGFGGAWPAQVFATMRSLGMRITTFNIKTVSDAIAAAQTARGPIVFTVRWANGAGHTVVAFRDLLGKIRFADQFGRKVANMNAAVGVDTLAGLVHDADMLQLLRAALAAQLGSGLALPKPEGDQGSGLTAEPADDGQVYGLAVPLHPVNPEGMRELERVVRQKTGRAAPGSAPIVPGKYDVTTSESCFRPNSDMAPVCVGVTVKRYTVGTGDTLSLISQRVYGTSHNWQRIYDANRRSIGPNPHLLRIGMVLDVP